MEVLWTATCTEMRIECFFPITIQLTLRVIYNFNQLYAEKDRKHKQTCDHGAHMQMQRTEKYVLNVAEIGLRRSKLDMSQKTKDAKRTKKRSDQTAKSSFLLLWFKETIQMISRYMGSVCTRRPLNLMSPRERKEKATDCAAQRTR